MPRSGAPTLSIGLPVFNGEQFLHAAVGSLLSQTFTDFELVISDNCSTDRTAEICQELAAQDERIRYHRNEENIGAARNFNKVVSLSKGRYFAWANHDDIWEPHYFEKCVEALEAADDIVLAYTQSTVIDQNGDIIATSVSDLQLDAPRPSSRVQRYLELQDSLQDGQATPDPSINGLWVPVYGVIRREVLEQTALIGSYIASDTVLLEELLAHGPFRELDEVLFQKRVHANSSTHAHGPDEDRIYWFTGTRGQKFLFPKLRVLAGRLRLAFLAPKSIGEKWACLRIYLMRYLGRRQKMTAFAGELLANAKRALGAKSSAR